MVPEQVTTAEHGFYDTVVCSTYLIPAVVALIVWGMYTTESLRSMKGLASVPFKKPRTLGMRVRIP